MTKCVIFSCGIKNAFRAKTFPRIYGIDIDSVKVWGTTFKTWLNFRFCGLGLFKRKTRQRSALQALFKTAEKYDEKKLHTLEYLLKKIYAV